MYFKGSQVEISELSLRLLILGRQPSNIRRQLSVLIVKEYHKVTIFKVQDFGGFEYSTPNFTPLYSYRFSHTY